ncbi:Threonine/homoserine/homoserine lactone efflux protein [Tistlia consotensis]|uniref:Threonine/homoserine/homoserine lactone efflux protein n=1 Tax=Tistlia consotensis USBA 355 TaxID=560819 RepID=A0A1Y6BLQ9_9PROT|nr:LysE family translocator [Tistlia consotensis]SMF16084.1 Threonine/homoserine/homoserine lactone efflux protein [Tistlia consotensis USBA 355]SNR41435.1 Threonine/homoserine/homoserine lactone efflux protein [Tistlia consotensis]
MTVTESLVAFLLAAGLLTITPGLDTALVLRTAAVEGARRAAAAALGINAGCLVWGAAVALGLAALLAASQLAFEILKWCGAGYLGWLGLQLLRRPRSGIERAAASPAGGRLDWFWKGLAGNLLNPKVGVFYVSFLPQFVPHELPLGIAVGGWCFLLAGIHVLLGLAWCSGLILATRPLARALQRPGVVRLLDRLTGCLFLGFGAGLLFARR